MVTGQDILNRALRHEGEAYVFGAFMPKDAPNYRGPWDCAEFVSKMVFEESGLLYGTSNHTDPRTADAWTGFWLRDAQEKGRIVSPDDAARTPGAVLLRVGVGIMGHVVIADGRGGTIEAASARLGVTRLSVSGRRWTHGVFVPGIAYAPLGPVPLTPAAVAVLRLTNPYARGEAVRRLQTALGVTADGIYGPATYAAVLNYQHRHGLIIDGEAGSQTFEALGLDPVF